MLFSLGKDMDADIPPQTIPGVVSLDSRTVLSPELPIRTMEEFASTTLQMQKRMSELMGVSWLEDAGSTKLHQTICGRMDWPWCELLAQLRSLGV